MKKVILSAFSVICFDQIIKAFVRRMPEDSVFFELPGWIEFTHVTNTGAAFSLFSEYPTLLMLVSLLLMLLLCLMMFKLLHLTRAAQYAAMLLLAGGIGNWIDRVLYGGVTDYIRLLIIRFPVFNLADIATTCSCAALLLLLACNRLESSHTEEHHESAS